jgi:hypothetical protein
MRKSILGLSKLLEISGSATKKACICSEAKDTGDSLRAHESWRDADFTYCMVCVHSNVTMLRWLGHIGCHGTDIAIPPKGGSKW